MCDKIIKHLTNLLKKETDMDNLIRDAVDSLVKVERTHRKLILKKCESSLPLPRTRHVILVHIANKKKITAQKEVAELLNITPAAVTGAIKKLENDGYVSRSSGEDNRYNEVEITQKGIKFVESATEMFYNVDKYLFEGFTEEELKHYIYLQSKIKENIIKQIDLEEGKK